MNKSKIEKPKPEPKLGKEPKSIVNSSAQIAQNAVLGEDGISALNIIDDKCPFTKMLLKLPIIFDWANFKDETVFIGANFEATKKAKKPMFDIFYCATEALNHNVLETVQWDKKKFKPSELGANF